MKFNSNIVSLIALKVNSTKFLGSSSYTPNDHPTMKNDSKF